MIQPPPEGAITPAATVISRSLFRKYVGLFIAVICVGLISPGPFEIWFSYHEHEKTLVRMHREQAETAALKIGHFIKEIEDQIGWVTQLRAASAPRAISAARS
jgi:hypothetical protein